MVQVIAAATMIRDVDRPEVIVQTAVTIMDAAGAPAQNPQTAAIREVLV